MDIAAVYDDKNNILLLLIHIFLANLGGSFALCLGMSMLSLLEIIYFLLVRMSKHFKRIFQVGPVIPKFTPIIVKKKY